MRRKRFTSVSHSTAEDQRSFLTLVLEGEYVSRSVSVLFDASVILVGGFGVRGA